MKNAFHLMDAYRFQRDVEITRMLKCMGDILSTDKTALAKRKAYWKASRKISAKIFPRGKNFALHWERPL